MQQPFVGVRQDDVCFCEEVGSPLLRVNMKTPQEFKITTSKETVAVASGSIGGNIESELMEAGVLIGLAGVYMWGVCVCFCVMIKNFLQFALFLYF